MNRRSIILLSLVCITILTSSFLFYRLFSGDKLTSVYTYAYGQETTFELARLEDVSNVRVSTNYEDENVTFKVPDKGYFIDNYVLNHNDFVISYELYYEYQTQSGGYYRTFYIFEHEKQLFSLHYNDELDIFKLNHVGAYVRDLYLPFPTSNFFFDNYEEGEVILWENINWNPWNSFDDAATFYESISDFQSIIDYDQKTIQLNGLRYKYSSNDLTENYPVTLQFESEGFSTHFEESQD